MFGSGYNGSKGKGIDFGPKEIGKDEDKEDVLWEEIEDKTELTVGREDKEDDIQAEDKKETIKKDTMKNK